MIDYIALDDDGNVVAKYRANTEPSIPETHTLKQVDDVSEYEIDEQVDWFPAV